MKTYRVIYSEAVDRYLAQLQVEFFGWGGKNNSEGMEMEKWLKITDWVETEEEAKFDIHCHIEFEKSQTNPIVICEVSE